MSELILLPGDVIANSENELSQEFLDVKRAAEEKAALEVLPFEAEKARVTAEHASIWPGLEPLASPAVLSESERKA